METNFDDIEGVDHCIGDGKAAQLQCDMLNTDAGFALPIAIVAKCEEKLFLAQKKYDLAKASGEKKFSP